MKKILFSILISAFFSACQSDSKPTENNPEPAAAEKQDQASKTIEDLRASALSEEDVFGRVEQSLVALQNEYRNAEGKVPGVGKVTVFLDEHLTLLLKNELPNETIETKVNLRHLNPNNGMTLVPDLEPGQFPGLKIAVLDGMPGVTVTKNGELESEERALEIYLPERVNIENITAPLTQALNIAHGKY